MCRPSGEQRSTRAVRCDANERQQLEQLCCYITRPALANERVQINRAGQVVLKLKSAWRDGTTHIVMSPLEFMQRLAARATEGCLSCARAATAPAPDPLPRGAGAQCQATGHGGAAWPRAGHRQIRANADRARLRTRAASPHQLGSIAQAHVPDRPGALPKLRRPTQDHRRHPGSARDRADPHAPGTAGPDTAPGASARRSSAGGVIAARGLRGGAAPDAGRAR